MDSDGYGKPVVQGNPNFSALRNSNERIGILKRMSSLPERIHREYDAILSFGVPFAFRDLELNRQYTIAKNPRWGVVLIGYDWRYRFSGKAGCDQCKAQQKQLRNLENGEPAPHVSSRLGWLAIPSLTCRGRRSLVVPNGDASVVPDYTVNYRRVGTFLANSRYSSTITSVRMRGRSGQSDSRDKLDHLRYSFKQNE